MPLEPTPRRAAQYVRMSSEHQQHSPANQKEAIRAYATDHGIEIVSTYEDPGKSGLSLAGRPALRKLIADVVGGQTAFEMILVYDVSRWGRFQDTDESAHLEYLCRLAGVPVEYCAEPFSNDGSPFSSICKVVKRTLAAEYSRELSHKVYLGKARLIALGFRQGGSAGLGLRRCLVDAHGVKKRLLEKGEYKSITTDRVILVPGPANEIALVQRIYSDYARKRMGVCTIAANLNREGVKCPTGRQWSRGIVRHVLTSEKYVGNSVWGRQSWKLKAIRKSNAPESWIRHDGAFQGIVSRPLFDRAQRRLKGPRRPSDKKMLDRMRRILRKYGEINSRLIEKHCCKDVKYVAYRFGGLIQLYDKLGYRSPRKFGYLAWRGAGRRCRAAVMKNVEDGVRALGGATQRVGRNYLIINGEITASVSVALQLPPKGGHPRWRITRGRLPCDLVIVALMNERAQPLHTYYFLPASELGWGLALSPRNTLDIDAFRFDSLDRILELCTRCDAESFPLMSREQYSDRVPEHARSTHELSEVAKRLAQRASSLSKKRFLARFLIAIETMRGHVSKADAVHARMCRLRQTLSRLLAKKRFVRLLASNGIDNFPRMILAPDMEQRLKRADMFQARLRERSRDLLTKRLTPSARKLLNKLKTKRRNEAAEFIVLANDATTFLARAVLMATPLDKFIERPAKNFWGKSQSSLKETIDESLYVSQLTKRALTELGYDSLDLLALESFARRLLALPSVVEWLERNDAKTLMTLRKRDAPTQRLCEKRCYLR